MLSWFFPYISSKYLHVVWGKVLKEITWVSNWRHIFVKLVFSWGTTEHHQTCCSLLWLTGLFKYYKCNSLDLSYDVYLTLMHHLTIIWCAVMTKRCFPDLYKFEISHFNISLNLPFLLLKLYQHFPQIMWKSVRLLLLLHMINLQNHKW